MPEHRDQSELIAATVATIDAFPIMPFITQDTTTTLQKVRLKPALPISTEFITTNELLHHEGQEFDPEFIIEIVAAHQGVEVKQLLSRARTRDVSEARNLAVYLIRDLTQMSSPEIGKFLDRDHSTIISAEHAVRNQVQNNPRTHQQIEEIKHILATATRKLEALGLIVVTSTGLAAFMPERIVQHDINRMLPVRSEYGLGRELSVPKVINEYYPDALLVVKAISRQFGAGFAPIAVDVLNHYELCDPDYTPKQPEPQQQEI